ncbi:hypothetical protein [Methanobacterium sp.]|jgi:hypothetical protein|uniref:hypothetical protein n=1 Tax=Methanobacterium sp. TaxID=2164 RepID=UPI0031588C25
MGFLKCKSCGGFYELQPGESPDQFESCHCGGELEYYNSRGQKKKYAPIRHGGRSRSKSSADSFIIVMILAGIVLMGVFLVYPFVMMFGGMVFFDWKFNGGLSAGGYVIIILLMGLVGSAVFTGYHLFKIILRANS